MVHEKPRASDKRGIYIESPKDVWESDMLYDAGLMHQYHIVDNENEEVEVDNENEEVEEMFEYLGCIFISCSRKPDFICWQKDCFIHAKDIINTAESQLWGSSSHVLQLNDLFVYFPTLSMDGNELYMVSKVNRTDHESHVIVVDLAKTHSRNSLHFPPKDRISSRNPTLRATYSST